MEKTIVLTGASDGIGATAAKRLREMGHRVVIVGRNPKKTEAVARELDAPWHTADYASLREVERLAGELRQYGRIDVLANNAGGAMAERFVTEDGFEKTFQVNLLGGFLLTHLLLDRLIESRATVIQTASIAANLFGAGLDPSDPQSDRDFDPLRAYGRAKLEGILITRELQRRFGGEGLSAVAFEPGIVRTNFASEANGFLRFCYHSPLKYLFTVPPQKGAERLTRLAVGEAGKDFVPGEVYSGTKPMRLKFQDPDGSAARRIWQACECALRHK